MKSPRLLYRYFSGVAGSALFWAPTVLFLAIALFYVAFGDTKYSATSIVLPVADSATTTELGGLAGQVKATILGAGIGLGSESKQRNRQILKSRRLAVDFIHEYGLLETLFPDLWDPETQMWRTRKKGAFGLIGPEESGPPSDWFAVDRLRDKRAIRADELSGAISITYTFEDPETAARVTNAFVTYANQTIQSRDLQGFTRNLDYLRDHLEKENNPALIMALSSLIEEQLRQIMLANGQAEYAFSIVDPAVVPEEPAGPGALVVLTLGLAVGVVIGILLLALERSLKSPAKLADAE